LLDTHAWVWWLTRPERLSRGQRAAIERVRRSARQPLLVSIISCWEVALLAQRGRLQFSIDLDAWLEQATKLPGVEVVPLSLATISIVVRLAALRDPADQLVVATALERGARLVTSDSRIAETELVAVVS
jgi:PIN domain nuclease of toxin-antitoxin system